MVTHPRNSSISEGEDRRAHKENWQGVAREAGGKLEGPTFGISVEKEVKKDRRHSAKYRGVK